MTRDGKIIELRKEQISFEYRKSSIPDQLLQTLNLMPKLLKKK